jgi:hypothetical protein
MGGDKKKESGESLDIHHKNKSIGSLDDKKQYLTPLLSIFSKKSPRIFYFPRISFIFSTFQKIFG